MGEITTSHFPVYDDTVAATGQQHPLSVETEDGKTFADVADVDPDQPAEEDAADDDE
jgi:hypothetical protein